MIINVFIFHVVEDGVKVYYEWLFCMIGTPDHQTLQKPAKLPFNLKNEESPKTSIKFRHGKKGEERVELHIDCITAFDCSDFILR